MVCGVAVLCCLPVLASALPVSVPSMTPIQLRDRIVASSSEAYAGYAESNATFGLPSLQGLQSLTALLDGVTRMRVWQGAPDWWRVDVLSDVAERDQYQTGNVGYVWDSSSQLLTRVNGQPMFRLPEPHDLLPPSLADRLLKEAGPDAKFSMLPPQRVAGQNAAGLRVVPADPASTIGQVDIWANPDSGLPLLVQILSRGSAVPALETQFLQVSSWQLSANVLTPEHGPGSGYTVTTASDFTGVLRDLFPEFLPLRLAGRTRQPVLWQYGGIGVYGSGLTTFAVLAFSGSTGFNLLDDAQSDGATPLQVTGGTGVLASAPLINLIIVHRSYSQVTFLLAGFVDKQVLEQAAADVVTPP